MVTRTCRIVLIAALLLAVPRGARAADVAVLPGLMTGTRPGFGWVIGHAPSVAGFEIEYLSTVRGKSADRSVAGGVFGNLVVQPVVIRNLQPFGIVGFGMWGESFADGGTGALGARDIGGGVKVWVTDRLRLRLDYRLFLLGDVQDGSRAPSTKRPQRISAGIHLAF
jgi:hypothetical protein